MQRLGRGGRGHGTAAIGLYLVEQANYGTYQRKRGRNANGGLSSGEKTT